MSTTPTPAALVPGMRDYYQQQMLVIRNAFETTGNGMETVAARTTLVDSIVTALWREVLLQEPDLAKGMAIIAIGGYGRKHLFPGSDIDLLFLLDGSQPERVYKQTIRRVCQEMWDCGMRVSPQTRTLEECARTDTENIEFLISLLDERFLFGDETVHQKLVKETLPRRLEREGKSLLTQLAELTIARHDKYGNTIFHLEPSIKDCPGGLRDSNFCHWWLAISASLQEKHKGAAAVEPPPSVEMQHAQQFFFAVRCFLHYRASRDDNSLDWQAQDEAAARSIGSPQKGGMPPAYWMRLYFRHARTIERRTLQLLDEAPRPRASLYQQLRNRRMRLTSEGFRVEQGRILLDPPSDLDKARTGRDPAHDPEVVLNIFQAMAETGAHLARETEDRLVDSLPLLASHLEDGAALWNHLRRVLLGRHAGNTLRAMHAIGILELIVPEFHGIDALVVRDAYHRYTVDEHTFVLIDTLHGLAEPRNEWEKHLYDLMQELAQPELLYLAGLLHDTGKGREGEGHAVQSVILARSVLQHMELDAYESSQVIQLIAQHLDMSLALRRDIFDMQTVHNFAGKVGTPEMLRMLTLFTFADISAVHPDALTPWKAENLWRLYMATANHMDRSVDEDRVHADKQSDAEFVDRVVALMPSEAKSVKAFLEGFPQRYLRTRTPDQVRSHYRMAGALAAQPVQLKFHSTTRAYGSRLNELTLVTGDRPMLFASMAGALSAWGMDIVTADAFSNAEGIVVDSYHFNDRFKTLELNPSEHDRFIASIRDVLTGVMPLEQLLAARSRSNRSRVIRVVTETQITWDKTSSSHSTVLQVVAQDAPGLLRAVTATLATSGCNIEVALIDTEGDTAIDVFYLTRNGLKLSDEECTALEEALSKAIADNLAEASS